MPLTTDNWGNALLGTETDNPAPPTALQGPDDIPPETALGALSQLAEFREQVIGEDTADGGTAQEVGTLSDSLKRAAGVLAIGAVGTSETGIGLPAAAALAVGAGALLLVGMALDRGDGRDVLGHYADGNDGRSGKDAEKDALDQEEAERGITIERDQVLAKVEGTKYGRYYDGLMKNPDGTYTGYEVKSRTATKKAQQREFDGLVSPENPARATLNGKPIEITRVRDLRG
ncbi:hypothetical protein [Prescottella subtropica]|uniref:hypothetical protein n=1 Tax=Prescottella subtropica TaxID=2545757 RepID=UPI0010F6EB41|nr:hypothetical protein [Prescottella subtropica]